MAFTDSVEWFIGIQEDGQMELRRTRLIFEDGQEVGSRAHSTMLFPGQDVTTFPVRVRQVCQVVWTPQVIAAWQARQQ